MSVVRLSAVAALALALTAGSAMASPKWSSPSADPAKTKADHRLCRKIAGRVATGQMGGLARVARLEAYVPNQGMTWVTSTADVNSMAAEKNARSQFMGALYQAKLEENYFGQCMTQLGYSKAAD